MADKEYASVYVRLEFLVPVEEGDMNGKVLLEFTGGMTWNEMRALLQNALQAIPEGDGSAVEMLSS